MTLEDDDEVITVTADETVYRISRVSGLVTDIVYNGAAMITEPIVPTIWRAPTDNDRNVKNGCMQNEYHRLGVKCYEIADVACDGTSATITAKFSMGVARIRPVLSGTVTYTVNGGGITFRYDMNVRENLRFLPRFGIRLTMPEGSEHMSCFGFGPHESYQDKRLASRLGLFSGTVTDNYDPYVRPQENGAHADCRFAKVAGLHGQGLYFFGDNFSFSASHFTPEQLTETAHAYELIPNKETTVILDKKQSGIGSHSCGPQLASRYRFSETAFTYTVRILPAVTAGVRPFDEMRVDY